MRKYKFEDFVMGLFFLTLFALFIIGRWVFKGEKTKKEEAVKREIRTYEKSQFDRDMDYKQWLENNGK